MGFFQKKCVGLYGVCQKQTMKCQKFSFWQNCGVFGSVFGTCLMIEVAEMPRNKGVQGLYGECQKFNFWQNRECFWHFGRNFWQITDVIVSGKPLNRAFVRICRECQKFWIWQEWDVFGKVFGIAVCASSQ